MTLVWTIIILALIYAAIGLGAEFINTSQSDDPFEFNMASLKRIMAWPKYLKKS